MHIFFQNNQYLGFYYFTRSADDPVDALSTFCMNGTDIADCDPAQHTAPSQPHQAVLCRSVDHWTNSFVKVGRYFVIAQAVETVDSGWLLAGVSHNCLSRPIFVIANHLNCTEVFLSLSPMTLSALSSADDPFIGFIASTAHNINTGVTL